MINPRVQCETDANGFKNIFDGMLLRQHTGTLRVLGALEECNMRLRPRNGGAPKNRSLVPSKGLCAKPVLTGTGANGKCRRGTCRLRLSVARHRLVDVRDAIFLFPQSPGSMPLLCIETEPV